MYVGKPLPRDEDYRFLTGRGRYVDDLLAPGAAHAAFVRSPHAHARVERISTGDAGAMPGVRCVLTAAEWDAAGLGRLIPPVLSVPFDDGRPMNCAQRPVFARDVVRHVGDQVAAVIAETATQAQDAAEAVEVEYGELPALTDVGEALSPQSPVLHSDFATNAAHVVALGDSAPVRAAFARAAHVTELDIRTTRVTGSPMEPRAYLGAYDSADRRYTLHASAQLPQALRRWLATHVFELPQHRIRVVCPDVGGGFGTKAYYYPEIPVVLYAARLAGRPVRFTATRQESYASDTHARDFLTRARLALDAEGRMLALEFDALAGHGAYESSFNPLIAADALGVDIADVEFRQGDTDRDAGNFGTGAMRSVATAGVAVAEAGGRVVEKGKRLAAHLLEAADEDLEYANGRYSVVGTDRGIAFREIARMAHTGNDYPESGFELGLDEVVFHDPLGDTFPTGMHLVVLRVDIETGTVALRDYYTVDDCGLVINPLIVDGQIHGGLAQGIGQALQEQIVYDESGQLLTASFLDYAMPRADMMPPFRLSYRQTPSPHNPLGVKGVGECGSNGPPSAIGNALVDALRDLGVRHLDPPYTPFRVWQAIGQARSGALVFD